MRDILFRGKRIDNGEWVEGYYAALLDAVGMTHMIHTPRCDPDDSNRVYFIAPDTLGQYTGLNDRNGRMIFEGDIVQWHSLFYPICWIDKYARFAAKPKGAVFAVIPFDQGEVVGNIYDNPELLNGGESGE